MAVTWVTSKGKKARTAPFDSDCSRILMVLGWDGCGGSKVQSIGGRKGVSVSRLSSTQHRSKVWTYRPPPQATAKTLCLSEEEIGVQTFKKWRSCPRSTSSSLGDSHLYDLATRETGKK